MIEYLKKIFINFRLTLSEIFLLELIFYVVMWLSNPFLAKLLTLSIAPMVCAVLILSLIAELLDKTKVPRRYFYVMALSVLAPIMAWGIMQLF